MNDLAKEIMYELNSRSLNVSKFCRDHNISYPTMKKVMNDEKVSEGTLYKLKSILGI